MSKTHLLKMAVHFPKTAMYYLCIENFLKMFAMKYFTLLFVSAIVGFACHRKVPAAAPKSSLDPLVVSVGSSLPSCIEQKIDSIRKLPVWNPPAQIEEYEYNGKKVFVVSADCCDFFTTAYDENCNYICAPSGGFTGRGDGLCNDFNEKGKLVKQVWKDERTRAK